MALAEATQKLEGTLILVNYAEEGTAHADEIKLINVIRCSREEGVILTPGKPGGILPHIDNLRGLQGMVYLATGVLSWRGNLR